MVVPLEIGYKPLGEAIEKTANEVAKTAKGGTYLLEDPATGKVMRVGRTKDLARRAAEHKRNPLLKSFDFVKDIQVDDYAVQRGREQILHDLYEPPLDKIRPLDPKHPKYYDYMQAVEEFWKQFLKE